MDPASPLPGSFTLTNHKVLHGFLENVKKISVAVYHLSDAGGTKMWPRRFCNGFTWGTMTIGRLQIFGLGKQCCWAIRSIRLTMWPSLRDNCKSSWKSNVLLQNLTAACMWTRSGLHQRSKPFAGLYKMCHRPGHGHGNLDKGWRLYFFWFSGQANCAWLIHLTLS